MAPSSVGDRKLKGLRQLGAMAALLLLAILWLAPKPLLILSCGEAGYWPDRPVALWGAAVAMLGAGWLLTGRPIPAALGAGMLVMVLSFADWRTTSYNALSCFGLRVWPWQASLLLVAVMSLVEHLASASPIAVEPKPGPFGLARILGAGPLALLVFALTLSRSRYELLLILLLYTAVGIVPLVAFALIVLAPLERLLRRQGLAEAIVVVAPLAGWLASYVLGAILPTGWSGSSGLPLLTTFLGGVWAVLFIVAQAPRQSAIDERLPRRSVSG